MAGWRPTGRVPSWVQVPAGERVLAWAASGDSVLAGTRTTLYAATPGAPLRAWRWEALRGADWLPDEDLLRVRTTDEVCDFPLLTPGLLLQLIRERVTASVVLQRHLPVRAKRGVRIVARRAPHSAEPLTWTVEYDPGLDPDDPAVAAVVARAYAAARSDLGE